MKSVERIKETWDGRARDEGLQGAYVTMADRNQRILEIEEAQRYIPSGQRILDVGCGDGYSTVIFAKQAKEIVGIDYSEPMIDRAKRQYGDIRNATFEVRDILTPLPYAAHSFDVAVAQRCFINLGTWENQQRGLDNVTRVIRPGGYFILQEGTQQGREGLNQLRERMGLERMPEVTFNTDLDEERLWPFLRKSFDVVQIRRYGLYDVVARVVHPLLVAPAQPSYEAKINEIARNLSAEIDAAGEASRWFTAFLRVKRASS
ncbi:MAG TPA: class I SAM-dependent methyltransferase [Candidatus Limnocylindria bacterium]|nr:class I SAM-dependent methyltransferase [Candidatus Limnocylindria bacterium]